MTLKVIHRLQAFSNAILRTFVQHFTWFQLTVCSHGSSALAELFVLPKQRIVSLISRRTISVKFEHKMWIRVVMNSFKTELRIFSNKGSFTSKKSFFCFFRHTSGPRAPTLAFESRMNLSIASYSRRAKFVSSSSDFRMTYRHAKSPLISWTARNFATFRLQPVIQRRLVR